MSLKSIRERASAATPGPWRWGGNVDNREIYLSTTHSGRIFVMRFVRWGMHQAQFRLRGSDGLGMTDASDWVEREQPYRGDIKTFAHPDAQFIAHARTDVELLLDVAEAAAAGAAENVPGCTCDRDNEDTDEPFPFCRLHEERLRRLRWETLALLVIDYEAVLHRITGALAALEAEA